MSTKTTSNHITKIEDYPLSCYTITHAMNLLQSKSFDFDMLHSRVQNFQLLKYEIEDICLSFTFMLDSRGNLEVGKYIFNTNLFAIMLIVHEDSVYMGFMHHNLDFIVDELNGISTLKVEDIKHYFDDFRMQKISSDYNIEILPLTHSILDKATKLRDESFSHIPKIEQDTLIASIDKHNYKRCYKINDIESMQYYVAYKGPGQLVGLVGVYNEIEDDENMCQLGWFCVDRNFRKNGIGSKLLDFCINKAKQANKEYLHTYTYRSDEFECAIKMYKKYGFKQYKLSCSADKDNVYLKLDLRDNQ